MPEALVIIEGLEKKFVHMGRELHVLKGIDLIIYRGQILSIVGPSGAGKSTLLHIIGTLDLPSAGKIRFGGEELTTMDSRERPVETLAEAEEDQIRRVLAATGGNKSKAAQVLGIERKTLYRKLERMKV